MSQGDPSPGVQEQRFNQALSELKADGLIDGDFNPDFEPGFAVGFADGSVSMFETSAEAREIADAFPGASEVGGVTQPPKLLRALGLNLFRSSTIFGTATAGGLSFETSRGMLDVGNPILSTKMAIIHEFAHLSLGVRDHVRANDIAAGRLGLY